MITIFMSLCLSREWQQKGLKERLDKDSLTWNNKWLKSMLDFISLKVDRSSNFYYNFRQKVKKKVHKKLIGMSIVLASILEWL